MTLTEIMNSKRRADQYILARYFYCIGEPILSDATYDKFDRLLRQAGFPELEEYFNRSYDDDPVPFALLNEIGVEPVDRKVSAEESELLSVLDEQKSLSIHSITEPNEAFTYFQRAKLAGQKVVASLKMDGINTKMAYIDGRFKVSMSRARAGYGFNFTDQSKIIMPETLPTDQKEMRVIGESFCDPESLPYLKDKYDASKYKTAKSSALSMLRVKHDREDYKYLKTYVFYAEGLAPTLSETFQILKEHNVNVPPYLVLDASEAPDTYDEFCKWLKATILDPIWVMSKGLPSDGVVLEIDDFSYEGVTAGIYNTRQLALKFDHWAFTYYKGIITDIKMAQQRVFWSVRLMIEPVKTDDDCTATVINSYSPSILVENDLYVGKTVYFERDSGAINKLIYGDRLAEILQREESNES